MTTQRRITRPGMHDNEYMTVTCTPDRTGVEFFEFETEAIDSARANLQPSVTTYAGKVLRQGQHAERGNAHQIAILVEVDPALKRCLLAEFGVRNRDAIALALEGMLKAAIETLRATVSGRELRAMASCDDDEKTHPGIERECPHCRRTSHTLSQMAECRMVAACARASDAAAVEMFSKRIEAVPPPVIRCHPGLRCTNWPECEHCGPPRVG